MSNTLAVQGGILPRVKTFCVGTYDAGTKDELVCTAADLAAVVRNFQALSMGVNPLHRPPVAKGHEEDLTGELSRTDQPACGWVTNCWVEGPYLYTRWEQIPDDVAAQINAREYRYPSAEFYTEPSQGNLPGSGWCLRRVVILGATPPRNKQLGELGQVAAGVAAFSDNLRFVRVKRYKGISGKGSYIKCFSEGSGMDRATMESALLAAGWSQEELDQIKDDVALGVIVAHQMAGGTPAAAPPAEAAAETPTKEAMIAELVAAGGDAEALAAMSDADLAAMYQQLKDSPPAPVQASEVPVTTPVQPAAPARQPTQIIHKFSERYLDKLVEVRVQRALAMHTAGDKQTRVNAICDQLVKEGKAAPARVAKADVGKRQPAGDIRLALEQASHIRAFGEGESKLETLAKVFLNGPKIKEFGEQLPSTTPLSSDRRQKLLAATPEGRSVLRAEKK